MRIVSLLPSATDVIAELGLLDSLVGISDDCNWPPEVTSKPLVARTRIDVTELSAAEIDRLVNDTTAESHSLYAVDAALMDELRPDLVITQDLCEVCAVSSGDLATACPVGTEVFSMNPRTRSAPGPLAVNTTSSPECTPWGALWGKLPTRKTAPGVSLYFSLAT